MAIIGNVRSLGADFDLELLISAISNYQNMEIAATALDIIGKLEVPRINLEFRLGLKYFFCFDIISFLYYPLKNSQI